MKITSAYEAAKAICEGALFLVGGRYIAPLLIVSAVEIDGVPEFTLADGTTWQHDPGNSGDVGRYLYDALKLAGAVDRVRGGVGILPNEPPPPPPVTHLLVALGSTSFYRIRVDGSGGVTVKENFAFPSSVAMLDARRWAGGESSGTGAVNFFDDVFAPGTAFTEQVATPFKPTAMVNVPGLGLVSTGQTGVCYVTTAGAVALVNNLVAGTGIFPSLSDAEFYVCDYSGDRLKRYTSDGTEAGTALVETLEITGVRDGQVINAGGDMVLTVKVGTEWSVGIYDKAGNLLRTLATEGAQSLLDALYDAATETVYYAAGDKLKRVQSDGSGLSEVATLPNDIFQLSPVYGEDA